MKFNCPECWAEFDAPGAVSQDASPTVCPECRRKRLEDIHRRTSLFPPTNSFLPSQGEVPANRTVRPHSSGRRVVRKSEPMAG